MKHLRLLALVLFILGISTGFALGQGSKSLKEAQKRILQLESLLTEERKDEGAKPLTDKELIKEIRALRKALGKVDGELHASENVGDDDVNAMLQTLRKRMETKGLQEKVKLKVVLELFHEMSRGKLPILVNRAAFADVYGPDSEDPYEAEVALSPIPTTMVMGTALHILLRQLQASPATYVIRGSYVEIVPEKYNTARYFLAQPLVLPSYEKRALPEVLHNLAVVTGATIHLDPNVHKEDTVITASFRNCSLEDALVVVTEMAQLKFVVLERSIFVTSRANARIIEQEEAARSKKRTTFKSIFDPPPPEKAAQSRLPAPGASSSRNSARLR